MEDPLATGGKTWVLQTAGTEMGNRFRRSSGPPAKSFRFITSLEISRLAVPDESASDPVDIDYRFAERLSGSGARDQRES
jgi:hypothetical protein